MATRPAPARALLPILVSTWLCWPSQATAAEAPGVLVHLFEWPCPSGKAA